MRFAAVDVGTNSIHLIVVEIDPYVGTTQTVFKAREMVRLGAGDALTRSRLGRKAIARGAQVIAGFVNDAKRLGAQEVRIAATSAVRDAKNRLEFIIAVGELTGLPIDVLSGREEARLIHLGVSRGYALDEHLACIVDIGGGSTEFIVADHARTYLLKSLPLGSLRLFEQFRSGDGVDMPALAAHVHALLDPLCRDLRNGEGLPGGQPIRTVIGTSGTWLGLAALDAGDRGIPFTRSHGARVELTQLRSLQTRMLAMKVEERRAMPGMSARRSDIIVAGNAIAIIALEELGLDVVDVCDRALREGLVADFLQRNHDEVRAVGDLRLRRLDSARTLGSAFARESLHEGHVAALAVDLLTSFERVEQYEPADRDLLVAAALMHDVGHAIHPSSHHKHSAYIVRNSELPGWRNREKDILAQIVRYHRRALPKPIHAEFMAFELPVRRQIERLAALLRIADGLDARHHRFVISCRFRVVGNEFHLDITADGDIEEELAAAAAKADLFTRLYGSAPIFHVVRPQPEDARGEQIALAVGSGES